ncbi:hypothetical protein CLOHYLEM_07560 [[Clostridium] hylemonae DSM 15053]|uniref:Uncharacterized protein n=1 Tax=[Clostridium] hylemonae DSM 15053 TaxID=553973 RepID=C0C623_9FIRM|nr:hypothetical protein CLOHYLEM_07560 [[Clostridium] hylemonae DSM 15053]
MLICTLYRLLSGKLLKNPPLCNIVQGIPALLIKVYFIIKAKKYHVSAIQSIFPSFITLLRAYIY